MLWGVSPRTEEGLWHTSDDIESISRARNRDKTIMLIPTAIINVLCRFFLRNGGEHEKRIILPTDLEDYRYHNHDCSTYL